MFGTNFSGAKRNEILYMKGGSKQNEILLQKQQLEISFQNISKISIFTHLCHRPALKMHGIMVNGRSVNSMRLACKTCSSHGSNLSRLGFEHIAKQSCLDFKTKRNSCLRKLIRNETKRNIFISNAPNEIYFSYCCPHRKPLFLNVKTEAVFGPNYLL